MITCKNLVITIALVAFCGIVIEATTPNASRCFRFTWLGPRFNNGSVFLNATCQDATRLADGVPCEQPLVASVDGTWPNVDYIWNHHSEQATCLLADNDVCAQYTYFFNGRVENSTYMCTRAVDANNSAVPNGCYQEAQGSFLTRVCFCRSLPGGVPCNSTATLSKILVLPIIFVLSFIINKLPV